MHILHAIESMDPSRGGPPQVCGHLASTLSDDHQVDIAAYSFGDGMSEFSDKIGRHQITLSGAGEKLRGSRSRQTLLPLIERSDAVHCHGVWEPLLVSAGQLARERIVPYVVAPHGMLDPWCINQKRFKKQIALWLGRRRFLEGAKFLHALSDHERDGIRDLGLTGRCEVIPNGVTLNQIDPLLDPAVSQRDFPQLADRPFVLFLGRLHPIKGLDVLAESLNAFFGARPDWQVALAGPDGGMRGEFESHVRQEGIADRVHLLGPVYGPAKYGLLARADLFCLPSRHEGCSMALLEAMAARTPLVISEHCHLPQVREHRCGLEVPLDAKSISNALIELAGSEKTRGEMGRNARQLIEREFTWERVSERLVSCYLD